MKLLDRVHSPAGALFVAEGEQWSAILAEAIHNDEDPDPNVESAVRQWQKRGRTTFRATGLGHAIRASGMSEEEAGQAIAGANSIPSGLTKTSATGYLETTDSKDGTGNLETNAPHGD